MSELLIRADASTAIGTGHVMRMIALAQAWRRRGGTARFLFCDCPEGVRERVTEEGFEFEWIEAGTGSVEDLKSTLAAISDQTSVVLDNYHYDVHYQKAVKAAARRLLVVDDYAHQDAYCCDMLLNQNPGAEDLGLAEKSSGSKLLLGTKFALVREEFLEYVPKREADPPVPPLKVLVTLGGGDPDNATEKVLRAIALCADLVCEVRVVLGAANPHRDRLRAFGLDQALEIEILESVRDMPALMVWADFVVSAAGSTCWELALMNCATAIVVVADNQRGIAGRLAEEGAVLNLGWHEDLETEALAVSLRGVFSETVQRRSLASNLGRLVDGRGADRVAAAIDDCGIWLRSATMDDCQLYFDWANESDVRRWSLNSEPIPWDDHTDWYSQCLKDSDCRMLVAESHRPGERPVGQIRFEREEGSSEWTISLSVDKRSRGNGFAKQLVELGSRCLSFTERGAQILRGVVKSNNAASVRLFRSMRFEEAHRNEVIIFTRNENEN